jgi:hypothetical protein
MQARTDLCMTPVIVLLNALTHAADKPMVMDIASLDWAMAFVALALPTAQPYSYWPKTIPSYRIVDWEMSIPS